MPRTLRRLHTPSRQEHVFAFFTTAPPFVERNAQGANRWRLRSSDLPYHMLGVGSEKPGKGQAQRECPAVSILDLGSKRAWKCRVGEEFHVVCSDHVYFRATAMVGIGNKTLSGSEIYLTEELTVDAAAINFVHTLPFKHIHTAQDGASTRLRHRHLRCRDANV
jgi:hypothetical protein